MSLKNIKKKQKNLLNNCKKFLIREKKKNLDISASPLCFTLSGPIHQGIIKL